MPKKKGKNDETTEATQARLLAAGAAEFFATARIDPFRSISLEAVAKRAGVTRNGLGYHWATKAEFCAALAKYITGLADLFDADYAKVEREVGETVDIPLVEAIRRVAALDLAALGENPSWSAMEVLQIALAPGNEELSETVAAAYRSVDEWTWTNVYGELISRSGREPRDPLSGDDVASLLQTLVEGAGIRQLVDPSTLGNPKSIGDGFILTGYALGVATLLAVLTKRSNGTDQRSVAGVLEELLADDDAVGSEPAK